MPSNSSNRNRRNHEQEDEGPIAAVYIDPETLQVIGEEEFKVPAMDGKGHDKRLVLHVHPGYINELSRIVQKGYFPYDTPHQLVRHAIKRHLLWLQGIKPMPDSTMHRLSVIDEVLYEEEEQQKFKDTINHMSAIITENLGNGMAASALRVVRKVFAEIEAMQDGDRKDQYKREISSRWGWMLVSGNTGVDLSMNGNGTDGIDGVGLFDMVEEEYGQSQH
jgi:hypothetical protein